MGVADPGLLELVARAFQELGHARALVVHGEPGMDEVSPLGATRVAELEGGEVTVREVSPEALGYGPVDAEGLRGGEPADNARIVLSVLDDVEGPPRVAVVLNAAAALWVSGRVDTLEAGVALAEESLASGAARDALERLKRATARG